MHADHNDNIYIYQVYRIVVILRFWAKIEKKIVSDFHDIIYLRNKNTITTMYSVLFYDKYFWSYCKISSV